MTEKSRIKPIHPGEILKEEFLDQLGISHEQLADGIRVSAKRIREIIDGKRSVTADTAVRLGKYFGMSPQFWLGLQTDYDLAVAEDRMPKIENEIRPVSLAYA